MPETRITLRLELLPEGGWLATSPDLPGLLAQGKTRADAVARAGDVARAIIASCRQHGDPLAPALHDTPPRFSAVPGLGADEPPRRLTGFTHRDITRKLRQFGFILDRQTPASDEVWRHTQSGRKVTIPHHTGELPEATLWALLRTTGVDIEDFLRD